MSQDSSAVPDEVPIYVDLADLIAQLEDIALTPEEQVILYGQINDIEDRIASLKRLYAMVRRRLDAEQKP